MFITRRYVNARREHPEEFIGCGSPSSGIPDDWAAGPSLPGVNLVNDLSYESADAVTEPICRYKGPGDVVVASIHWGSNWGYDVPAEQVAFAHRLIDRGIDVIHGHSSHDVRRIDVYRGKLILHGCGDLVTDYEGIRGHEEKRRGDLGVIYIAHLAVEDGTLVALQMAPTRAVTMRLGRADERRDMAGPDARPTMSRLRHVRRRGRRRSSRAGLG